MPKMDRKANDSRLDNFAFWSADEQSGYDPARNGFPVTEESVVQLDSGPLHVDATVAAFDDIALLRIRVEAKAIGTTVLDPDHLGLAIPVSWTGDYVINGEEACENGIYLSAGTDCVHVRGGSRDTLGVVLLRAPFVETVAALRGVDPADLTVADRQLVQATAAAKELRRRLGQIIVESGAGPTAHLAAQQTAQEVFGLMVDAYLTARPETTPKRHGIGQGDMIVKKAEECFMAAEGMPVSLADLCASCGVGKSALYLAFHRVVGLPPLEYFVKRRLTRAHVQLVQSSAQRGAVKRVALDAGFTEFGRFAADYRRLFGEPPSATLSRKFS
jgi:AraC family ethanolamine operon transcriptional activator